METTGQHALEVTGAGDTHIGTRPHNEDTVMLRPDLGLFLLADGAGGHNAGNVASTLAVSTVAHYFEETEDRATVEPEYDAVGLSTAARRLSTGIHRANRAVADIAKTSKRYRGMGTTIVAAFFEPDRSVVHIGHVGDSRCYRLRNGIFELLTHDHTLMNDVLALRPDMPDSQLSRLPRNVITRALGMGDTIRATIRTWELAAGDRFVLCSDGLTDRISGYQMVDALELASTPEEQVRLLLELAKEGPMDDNVAAVVIGCESRAGRRRGPASPTQAHHRIRGGHRRRLPGDHGPRPRRGPLLHSRGPRPGHQSGPPRRDPGDRRAPPPVGAAAPPRRPLRGRRVRLWPLVALCLLAGCPTGSGSGGPSRECTEIGAQCVIEDGLLGVCSVREGECAEPPCLICRPQH